MAVTAKEIAEYTGVSVSTVSRVLNGRGTDFISDATRQRVLKAAQELGYRPNRAARALVTGRTHTIALWMYSLHSSFHARVVDLVEKELHRYRYDCLIYSFDYLQDHLPPTNGYVDGILAHECIHRVRQFIGSPQKDSIPLVNMGSYYLTQVDHVGIDLGQGVREAMLHLLQVGCRRIAYLVNASSHHPGEVRGETYRNIMAQAGLEAEYIIAVDQTRYASLHAVQEYIAQHGCPDGIFCHNDQMAMGAYRALRENGYRIPDDVALVGCDGIEEIEFLDTPLSTIVQPLPQMCQIAWQFLQRRIEQPHLPTQSVILAPKLVIRQSSQR